MKLLFQKCIAITLFFSLVACQAKINNAKTETAKIYGNCEKCENTIEKAGSLDQIVKVDWNSDTKMASITFDSTLTNKEDILKRIAMSGYDSEDHLATAEVYNELADCCHYDRNPKAIAMKTKETAVVPVAVLAKDNPLARVYSLYFEVKDALVQTDAATTSAKAKNLVAAIDGVKMADLSTKVHTVWMKVLNALKSDAEKITATKDVEKQRVAFTTLSPNMYSLMKVTKNEAPVYYQYCPMANNNKGGKWLSTEKAIKNPYYGSKMMSCGGVNEIID